MVADEATKNLLKKFGEMLNKNGLKVNATVLAWSTKTRGKERASAGWNCGRLRDRFIESEG